MSEKALCECGCGELAPTASRTRRAIGHVKGQPIRFILGHRARLQAPGDPVQAGRRIAQREYELDGKLCENGCARPAEDRHHRDGDTRNNAPENVMLVCRRCHMLLDGRLHSDHQRARGAAHGSARLTEADVREIRAARPSETLASLAARFGVSQSQISAIANRRSWRHV